MLRWRLILGPLIVGLLTALCWADLHSAYPGAWLLPLAVLLCVLATEELLSLLRTTGKTPAPWSIYLGSLLPVLAASMPVAWKVYPADCPVGRVGWLACGLVAGLLVTLLGEMRQFIEPGKSIENLSAAALSILYVGGLLGFLVQLRLLPVAGDVAHGGMFAMLSMIVVAKATDIGAYTVGRLAGRHKMAPLLSPGKTWEGVIGGLAFGIGGSMLAFGPLANALEVELATTIFPWSVVVIGYALLVGIAGIIGDLAESMLKRDAAVKDSSSWLPGFGGVLDLLDSLLVAAPVAYCCWVSGLIG